MSLKKMSYRIHEYVRHSTGNPEKHQHAYKDGGKVYQRMESVPLPPPREVSVSLQDSLSKRVSQREFSQEAVTLSTISTLLQLSLSKDGKSNSRPYPSGGALYPIETYIIGSLEGYLPSVFHYEARNLTLRHLWRLPDHFDMAGIFRTKSLEALPPLVIVFTAIWKKNSAKYGDFGYYLGLLETGHMAQNILLTATALNMRACSFGGFDDQSISILLNLDVQTEQPVYVIALSE